MLETVHLEPSILAQRDQRIAASAYLELVGAGVRLSGDDNLGLHLGEAVRPGYYGVLGYLIMSCATLSDALHRQARYAALVGNLGRVELADEPPRDGCEPLVKHCWEALLPQQQRQMSEETLAGWVSFGHWVSGVDEAPFEVRFRHSAPADVSEHARIFRCPVLFDQPDNALVFPKRLLALPLGQADAQVQRTLDAYAERLLVEINKGDSVLDRARRELARQLPEQGADLEHLSLTLALSPAPCNAACAIPACRSANWWTKPASSWCSIICATRHWIPPISPICWASAKPVRSPAHSGAGRGRVWANTGVNWCL